MIKLIAIDLDGTICETKDIHFESLNKALQEVSPEHVISLGEHLETFNGLPTRRKLEILRDTKGLCPKLFPLINQKKQQYTDFFVKRLINPDDYKSQRECLEKLKRDGYKLACCSNAIQSSVITMLNCSVGCDVFDLVLSNQDCKFPKPNPSIYLESMAYFGISPKETLIIEDSPVGLESAYKSCANVMKVDGPQDIVYEKIVEVAIYKYLERL